MKICLATKLMHSDDVFPLLDVVVRRKWLTLNKQQSHDESFDDIDFDYYRMRKIRLSNVVKDHSAPMNVQVRNLYRYIAKNGAADENFAVVMDTMNNTEIDHRRSIHFYEETSAYLDEFIKNRASRRPLIRVRLTMNTITSTHHDTLLFLDHFPRNLALKIGVLFNEDVSFHKTIWTSQKGCVIHLDWRPVLVNPLGMGQLSNLLVISWRKFRLSRCCIAE
ncbi:unnamed protein product [Heligmosomoides polygyrus]|uniref:DNA helicase n=1 Tax=Heligmosomoides polygyrus TaxID=6339 RepID=A0A183G1A2_HELPZ|nr:unnamed protein product [Heligmosomoides polygyrus]